MPGWFQNKIWLCCFFWSFDIPPQASPYATHPPNRWPVSTAEKYWNFWEIMKLLLSRFKQQIPSSTYITHKIPPTKHFWNRDCNYDHHHKRWHQKQLCAFCPLGTLPEYFYPKQVKNGVCCFSAVMLNFTLFEGESSTYKETPHCKLFQRNPRIHWEKNFKNKFCRQ